MKALTTYQRAIDCIGQGALTNSKHPDSHILGIFPTHLGKKPGMGAFVYDEKGRQYIDYICGLGANLVGYGNGHVNEAIKANLNFGFSHSLPTLFEIETAESLKQMFYFVDKFKFVKTGSDACSAAIKMARAYTGRKNVLSEGYHGWHDEFVSLTPPATGVHTCSEIFPLAADVDPKTIAAIILEPIITLSDSARIERLKELRAYCDMHGIVLIYDETITGYRYDKHCVALSTNILPDLLILGKAIANGLPLAAVGGKAKILDGPYFVSSTYGGEILSLVAAKATTDLILNNQQYKIDKLWEQGGQFIRRFNNVLAGRIEIEGYPTRGIFKGTEIDVALLRQEACKAGILLHKSWFYNFPLMREDYIFFSFLDEFNKNLRAERLKLEGEMPKSPFSAIVREKK